MSAQSHTPQDEPTLVVRDEATVPAADETPLEDVKQLGLLDSIGSLSYVFWIVGAMEMVERLAFYGVIAVRGLYGTAAVEKGGLGVTPSSFAWIIAVCALFQSMVPVATGGLSDRYGYKETIFLS